MLSLTIDGNTIRLVESRRRAVVKWHSAIFNPSLVRRGSVTDPTALAQVIRKAMDAAGVKATEVLAAMDGVGSLSRVVSIPRSSSLKASEFIRAEARRLWSLDPEGTLLFWERIAGDGRNFFVLSMPREPLTAFANTIRAAGMKPRRMDIRPLALARAANRDSAIIVSVESSNVVVVVLAEGIPTLIQTHWLGETPLIQESLSPQVSTFVAQAMSYYADTHAGAPLSLSTPLLLCGAAVDAPLEQRLSSDTGHPAERFIPIFSVPPEFPVSQFAVNLGLLMKEGL